MLTDRAGTSPFLADVPSRNTVLRKIVLPLLLVPSLLPNGQCANTALLGGTLLGVSEIPVNRQITIYEVLSTLTST